MENGIIKSEQQKSGINIVFFDVIFSYWKSFTNSQMMTMMLSGFCRSGWEKERISTNAILN